MSLEKGPVVGYIVRMIHEEDRINDVAFDPKSHIQYPTFSDALKYAQALATTECERVGGKLIALVTQKSETACAKNGYTQLFEITGHGSKSVYAHALYAPVAPVATA